MSYLFKKSITYAFAVASIVFTFVPEAIFGKVALIPEILKQNKVIQENVSEINIVINRVLFFCIVWSATAIINKIYMYLRKKVIIKGNNYKIVVEYGNILKTKKCKRVISFDECFSTHVGNNPADINPTSICGQYLAANSDLNIQTLISNSEPELRPLDSKSKYCNKERYESGRIVSNGDDLLMAFAKLDENGLGCLSRDDYLKCLSTLWDEINIYYGQKDVCIPILGAGVTRFDGGTGASISQQELLDMIIWSYRLSSHKIKLPFKLRIICKRCEGFSLNKIDSQV